MRLLVTREVRWPTGAEKKTKTGYPPVKRTNAHRSRRCQKEARLRAVTPLEALTATISPNAGLRAVTPLEALTATISPNAETERPSSMPPVAGNGLGEHRARRPTGSRRASRQDDRPCVAVSRGRHPNRRSIRRRGLAAKHCRLSAPIRMISVRVRGEWVVMAAAGPAKPPSSRWALALPAGCQGF